MKPPRSILLAICLGFWGLPCALHSAPQGPGQFTIVTFGDSTTAPREGIEIYTDQLDRRLSAAGYSVRLANRGKRGDTTEMARARFADGVLAEKPDVVVMQFGINDSEKSVWKTPPVTQAAVPLAVYEADLRYFVDETRKAGGRPILMTPNPLRWTPRLLELYGRPPYNREDEKGLDRPMDSYGEAVRRVARELRVPLVDVHSIFDQWEEANSRSCAALLSDGMHPNTAGHILIANALMKLIPPMLARRGVGADQTGPDDRVVLNIEPNREHPRNSEGSFATLSSGRIVFYYAQFYGGDYDFSASRLVEIHSDDRGLSWSQPRAAVERGDNVNVTQVSLLRLASGQLAMFYMVMRTQQDFRPYMRLSTDEGATWSEPKCVLATPPGYYEVVHDRVIQTKNGRIIVPVCYYRTIDAGVDEWISSMDHRGIALWYYSDDEGLNWHESPTWWTLPSIDPAGAINRIGLEESGVVELSDGSLLSWFRNNQGMEYASRSSAYGGGTGNPLIFSAPEPTELKAPEAPISIKRMPGSNELLAVFNDHSGRFPLARSEAGDVWNIGGRTPLVAAISDDGGKTWPRRMLLESDPKGAFCYTAIHFVDDAVVLAYNAQSSQLVGHLDRLRIRRISLPWLRRTAK